MLKTKDTVEESEALNCQFNTCFIYKKQIKVRSKQAAGSIVNDDQY